ncbi:MAG: hypothetical protein KAS72_01295 [Phycisphaerales bacterium]|nr:hypothetical protein [Phycisphaerales bacterium]
MTERLPSAGALEADPLGRYDGQRLRRELGSLSLMWLTLFTALVVGLMLSSGAAGMVILGLALVFWLWANFSTIRADAYLREAAGALSVDDPQATLSALSLALRTFTIRRASKLLAYQQLSVVRYRQGRFAEASGLCWALLATLRRRLPMRGRIWLVEAECRLQLGDLAGTHRALCEAHAHRLHLSETLHLLAVQTAYESACGQDARLLSNLDAKVALVRMMSPGDGSAVLVHFSMAATRRGLTDTATDLYRHAELLGAVQAATHNSS